ncbi:hypothetical protein SEUCBS140593_010317 [Sporothrix eucalyptigena]|uniref:Zn(2)-C6 fungal-type domain-containing protein n=1 Tax=Sporothrix eucalyptigena TaxID=1812306 RepID=A0ABP0D104_9PEZI
MDTTDSHRNRSSDSEASSLTIIAYRGPGSRRVSATSSRKRRRSDGPLKIRNACIACREKKTRCSGHTPCIRCEKHNQPCEYMPTASPSCDSVTSSIAMRAPIRAPSSSSSSRELREPRELQELQGPPTVPLNRSPGQNGMLGPLPESSSSAAYINNDEDDDDNHRNRSPEEPLQQDQDGHFHGGSSEFAFQQFAKQRLAGLPSVSSILFTDHPLVGSGDFVAVLPPIEVARNLARVFFDFGLAATRFVHGPTLLESLERMYSNSFDSPKAAELTDTALVYMVLAMGSHYSHSGDMFSGYSASVRFFDMAMHQLNKDTDKVTLSSTQARLLSILYMVNHSRMHEAWSSFGLVVRHALALGLHRHTVLPRSNSQKQTGAHSGSSQHNRIAHEFRKRLFWSIYVHDRILSSLFGRPCALHDDDIDQAECTLANDDTITATSCELTRPGTFCAVMALVHYARLARILGQILRELYGATARTRSIQSLHHAALRLERELLKWQDGLPAYLDYVTLPPSAMSTLTQRQMCTLKLVFCLASLLLYRPFILYTIDAGIAGSTSASGANQSNSSNELGRWIRHCHDKAIEAAQTVVAECKDLALRGWFSRAFWLVNYLQFAAVGTLYMYSWALTATWLANDTWQF